MSSESHKWFWSKAIVATKPANCSLVKKLVQASGCHSLILKVQVPDILFFMGKMYISVCTRVRVPSILGAYGPRSWLQVSSLLRLVRPGLSLDFWLSDGKGAIRICLAPPTQGWAYRPRLPRLTSFSCSWYGYWELKSSCLHTEHFTTEPSALFFLFPKVTVMFFCP